MFPLQIRAIQMVISSKDLCQRRCQLSHQMNLQLNQSMHQIILSHDHPKESDQVSRFGMSLSLTLLTKGSSHLNVPCRTSTRKFPPYFIDSL